MVLPKITRKTIEGKKTEKDKFGEKTGSNRVKSFLSLKKSREVAAQYIDKQKKKKRKKGERKERGNYKRENPYLSVIAFGRDSDCERWLGIKARYR